MQEPTIISEQQRRTQRKIDLYEALSAAFMRLADWADDHAAKLANRAATVRKEGGS